MNLKLVMIIKYKFLVINILSLLFVVFYRDLALANLNLNNKEQLPQYIFIKSRTETFNSRAYFILKDGKIWTKINPQTNKVNDYWHLMPFNGLPFNKTEKGFPLVKKITEIHADGDELLVIDDKGRFFVKQSKSKANFSDDLWHYNISFPKEPRQLNSLTINNRSVTMGRRHFDVMWYEDSFGNQHNYGTMGTSSIYILARNGQEIYFTDNGLPADFSHTICGPDRGKFIAENLQASAGTMFVINSSGEMFTKMEDFDLNGGTSMFYNYTYVPYKSNLSGEDFKSGLTPFGLPLKDWEKQPEIILKGKAKLSRNITILQNGHGNAARELRVAGIDQYENYGYYSKNIFEKKWQFHQAKLKIENKDFLNKKSDYGYSKDLKYTGFVNLPGNIRYKAELNNFNLDCSPATLLIHLGNINIPVKLHTIEAWTDFKRVDPGRDGTYKIFLGTIEIQPDQLNLVPEELRKINLKTFAFSVSATLENIYVQLNKDKNINMDFGLNEKLPNFLTPKIKIGIEPDVSKYIFVEDFIEMFNKIDLKDKLLEKELNISDIYQLKQLIAKVQNENVIAEKLLNNQKKAISSHNKIYYAYNIFEKIAPILQINKITPLSDDGSKLLKAYHDNETIIFNELKKSLKDKSIEIKKFISIADKKLIELESNALFTEQKYSGNITIPGIIKKMPVEIPAFNLNKKELNLIISGEQYNLSFLSKKNNRKISFPIKMKGMISILGKPVKESLLLPDLGLKNYFNKNSMPVKIYIERDNIKIVSLNVIKNIEIVLQRFDMPPK